MFHVTFKKKLTQAFRAVKYLGYSRPNFQELLVIWQVAGVAVTIKSPFIHLICLAPVGSTASGATSTAAATGSESASLGAAAGVGVAAGVAGMCLSTV